MIKVYLNEQLKITNYILPPEYVQWNEMVVRAYAALPPYNAIIAMNFIKPDGSNVPPLFMEYIGADLDSGLHYYETTLTPWHTSVIPGNSDFGICVINFTYKKYINEQYVDWFNSTIIRIPVAKSTEPQPLILEPQASEKLWLKMDELEAKVDEYVPPFTIKGELNLLSELYSIVAETNDVYSVIETDKLYLWNGSAWITIGLIDSIVGPTGPAGEATYLHTAYADNILGTLNFSLVPSGQKYIGFYTDHEEFQSANPSVYEWTLLRGADGADGTDGTDGKNSYLHIAWADSANGITNFSTTISTNKKYIGTYTDFTSADSLNPTFYSWVLIKGADGANGSDGQNGLPSYLHIAYANSSNGSMGFSTTDSVDKTYIGTYTNFLLEDSLNYTDYIWTRIKGADGSDGVDGTNGQPSFIHIAWSTSANGLNNFSTSAFEGATYMGTYTDFIVTDSQVYTDYSWVRVKGEAGANGTDGIDGTSSYIHIAYAESLDGSVGFSTSVSIGKNYIGTYSDAEQVDSQDYTKYTWVLIKGADGSNGTDGVDGQSAYLHIAWSNSADGSVDFSTTISTNKIYIGTYTDFSAQDSQNYIDYSWVLVKGADGANGSDGINGDSAYIHVAWANSSNGSLDFSTSVATGKSYIGTYTDFNAIGSELYSNYSWVLIKGADGANGTDGINGQSAYLHIAYSTSSDGLQGFSTTAFSNATYLGTYTDFVLADSEVYTDYSWVLIKGLDGANGTDGSDGLNSYLHIAWSNSVDGLTDFSTTISAGKSYIGTYTNFIEADSNNYQDYDWVLIKGADGSNGSDGTDGQAAYLHIAYSTSADGSANFNVVSFEGAIYMGTYTDFSAQDSINYLDYTWVKIRGNDGINGTNGTDGTDGQSMYLHIAYATNSTGSTGFSLTYTGTQTYIGTYTDTLIADSTNSTKYGWKLFKGTDGTDGTDGTSVVLKGSVATIGNLPSGVEVGDLYVVLADGDGYVWNGSAWDNVGQIQGPAGIDGADGATTYIHYAYAMSSNGVTGFSLIPFVGALYLGIYTDFTLADSTNPSYYDWALIKGADGINGTNGSNGLSAYIHYAYSTSANGSQNFSTVYTGAETYVGWYTDFTIADSNNYLDYEWSLFKGQDGLDGNDGANGLPSYIHYAYSTAIDGSTGFNLSYTGNETYVGWYTDFTEADSINPIDYVWALFKGADGATGSNGLSAYIHYAYATSNNGSTGFSTTYTGTQTYVGWYTDFIQEDSNDYTKYEWQLFKGLDGINGTNGLTAYIHYAYSTAQNGSTGFSLTYTGVETYVGWYSDYTLADSNNPSDYEWGLFKGADGANGQDGNDGLSAYIHYAYSTSSNGSQNFSLTYTGVETYVGWYTNFILEDSINYADYEWQLFKGADGANGQDGNNGLSAYIHYAYAISSNGSQGFSTTYTGVEKYVGWYTDFNIADSINYQDYEWSLFTGQNGIDGTDGDNGLSAYIHYAYARSANGATGFTTIYTGVEEYVGWYSDFIEADSINYLDYTWQLFKGAKGEDGSNGLSAYIHYAYATSSNGAQGFNTIYTGVEKYVGWYTDFSATDSTNYLDYSWSLFKGADGVNGSDGSDGLSAYVHYAYATNLNGTQGFTLSYTGVETYVGWYTDFTVADSSDPNDYEWQLFRGADGVDGLNAFIHYAYASSEDGTVGFSTSYTGVETHVGWYTSFSSIQSTDPADYSWGRFRGLDGDVGPGLIYRGLYSSSKIYYANSDRRDVVLYNSIYYVAKKEHSPITGTWSATKWTAMQYFASVATDILLANDAAINKTLIIGDGTSGALRSYGMDSLVDADGVGFYLDGMTGHMTIGNNAGQNLKWNGSTLVLNGNITANSLTLLNNATITKRLTMGSLSEKGSIASYGMTGLTDVAGGFYMDGGGSFIFGKYGGNRVTWDGSVLNVVSKLATLSLTNIQNYLDYQATINVAVKNSTNRTCSIYIKVKSNHNTTEPSFVYYGTIAAGVTTPLAINSLYYANTYTISLELRSTGFTTEVDTLITPMPAPVRFKSFIETFTFEGGGSYGSVMQEAAYPAPIDGQPGRMRFEYETMLDFGSAGTNTMSATLPFSMNYVNIQTTGRRNNYTGSGVDNYYGYSLAYTSSYSDQITVVQDFASSANSAQCYLRLSGYANK